MYLGSAVGDLFLDPALELPLLAADDGRGVDRVHPLDRREAGGAKFNGKVDGFLIIESN